MLQILLGASLLLPSALDDPNLPKGTPAEQIATIRARLDAARAEYIGKFEKAETTADRNRLMKEVPRPEPFAEQMLRVAALHPNDPAAVDALLWVVGNTPPGDIASPNAKAKAALIKDYADSDRLTPFAVSLSYAASASDEDMLRRLLAGSKSNRVRAAATYALALQLVAQAGSLDFHNVRLEVAPTEAAKREVAESLDQSFGKETASRLRKRTSKMLTDEAEKLFGAILSDPQLSAAEWPVGGSASRLGEIAKQDLVELRTLVPGKPAPATTGNDFSGKLLSLADHKGKAVLLTFSGHWCVACRNLYPLERELARKHAGRPYATFGVNSDATREIVKKVIEEEKMTWPLVWDGGSTDGPLAELWNVRGWPLVVLIDHGGIIRYKFFGAPNPEVLMPLVNRLVDEAEAAGQGKK